jgi:hypothetical protein
MPYYLQVAHANTWVWTLHRSYTWPSPSLSLLYFYVGLRHVQYSEHFHFHNFGWLLLAAYIILLRNRKSTNVQSHMLIAYFAGAATSINEYLLQIPRQDKHKSLQNLSGFCGGWIQC